MTPDNLRLKSRSRSQSEIELLTPPCHEYSQLTYRIRYQVPGMFVIKLLPQVRNFTAVRIHIQDEPKIILQTSRVSTRGFKCDVTRTETRIRLSPKRMSQFKSARGGCQFSRLLAAEVCASAVVILHTPCSEVM